jgi:hypothetical protein
MPVRADQEDAFWRGDSLQITISVNERDELGEITGPFDIAGQTIIFTLKLDFTVDDVDADVYYSYTFPTDQGVINEHIITIPKEETAGLELACYTYQIKFLNGASETTYVWGKWPCKDS